MKEKEHQGCGGSAVDMLKSRWELRRTLTDSTSPHINKHEGDREIRGLRIENDACDTHRKSAWERPEGEKENMNEYEWMLVPRDKMCFIYYCTYDQLR